MKEKKPENEDIVKLKPFMGVRPGVYLTVLYSIALLFIVFFLFISPGIKNPSAVLYVKTSPAGAAIRLNDTYMGVSGERIRVRGGTYTIEAVMPGFKTESAVHEIPGRVFFSLFFPRRYNAAFTLKTDDPAGVLSLAAADFAAWSFGGEPTAVWQIPLSLSEGAYRMGDDIRSSSDSKAASEILTASARFAVTRAALRDLSRAKILLDNGGLSPSPAALVSSISDILVFLSENHGSAQWLAGLLPPESSSIIRASNWHKNDFLYQPIILPVPGSHTVRRLEVSGIAFAEIPEGTLIGSKEGLNVKKFLISENPVPKTLFENFLNENPEWKDEYTDYYDEEISVFPSETNNSDIITGISWFAAEAFCKWFSKRLPQSMNGMEARMPMEIEWEYAAMFGIKSMENPIWEWCADPFAPLQFIAASQEAVQAVGSPERSLLGRTSSASEGERASLPPEFSSPFVTLRLVIAPKPAKE